MTSIPAWNSSDIPEISSFIDDEINSDCLLPEDILEKRFQILDICTKDSTNSMCFTKSYSRYVEGTGSVYCPMTREELQQKISQMAQTNDEMELKKSLKLRFFSSKEVAKLMSFPDTFNFPSAVNEKQRYKLLGNSINVAVVSELIKLMYQRWQDVNELFMKVFKISQHENHIWLTKIPFIIKTISYWLLVTS